MNEIDEETRRAAVKLYQRFGRDAAVIALHNRQRASARGATAEVRAWQRIGRAILALAESAADAAWTERREAGRSSTPELARRLAPPE